MEFSKHGRRRSELQKGSIIQSHSPHSYTSSDNDSQSDEEAGLISGDRVRLEIQKGDINSLQNLNNNDTSSQHNYSNYEPPTTDDSNKNVSSSANIQQQLALPNEIKCEEANAPDNSTENVITESAIQMQPQPVPNEIKEVEAAITQDNSNESTTALSGILTYLRTRLNDAIFCIISCISCARPIQQQHTAPYEYKYDETQNEYTFDDFPLGCDQAFVEDRELQSVEASSNCSGTMNEAFGEIVHLELQRGCINSLQNPHHTLSQYNNDDIPATTNGANENVTTTCTVQQQNTVQDKIQTENDITQDITTKVEDHKIDINTQDCNNQISPIRDRPDQNQSHNASSPKESNKRTSTNATSNLHQANAQTVSFLANAGPPDVQQDLEEACGARHNHTSQSASFNKFTPTDAIINFVYEDDIYGKDGILETAGESVTEEYDVNRQRKDRVVRCGVVETGAGNLKPSQGIFHVTVFQHAAKFKTALHTTLRVADRRGMRSVAIPALPSDSPSGKALIDAYLDVFYEFEEQENPMCLHSIVIVNREESDYEYHDKQLTIRGETLKSSLFKRTSSNFDCNRDEN